MHILLATGIFPPEIGGPATYSAKLAEEFLKLGHRVTVVTYGRLPAFSHEGLHIIFVSASGNALSRWMRYANVLREHGSDSDAVIAFSSVSTGIPLMLAGLSKPKKILRLGGDFFWERYTDAGGTKSLREWYTSRFGFWRLINEALMEGILGLFDCIVYSTKFQQSIHGEHYSALPKTEVIGNAAPTPSPSPEGGGGQPHHPFRLLFMGRFVGFKNLPVLLDAIVALPDVTLTLVGSGPMEERLHRKVAHLGLGSRVQFRSPVRGEEKRKVFLEHDLLVLPSVTEISPNTALEAASEGLPVLLTEETGFSESVGICIRPLRTAEQIASAIRQHREHPALPQHHVETRTYTDVAQDWVKLLPSL